MAYAIPFPTQAEEVVPSAMAKLFFVFYMGASHTLVRLFQ